MIHTPNYICAICGNAAGNKEHHVREMMFGFRERFVYMECGACGLIQLTNPPPDMSRYYPPNYYSFSQPWEGRDNAVVQVLKQARAKFYLTGKSLLGRAVSRVAPIPIWRDWFGKSTVELSTESLDIGCGSGNLLFILRRDGFLNLTGIDPYIARTVAYPNGITIFKSTLFNFTGTYDHLMFHHSFEHSANPLEMLQHSRRILAPGGSVLIRIPVAGSYAWRTYGTN